VLIVQFLLFSTDLKQSVVYYGKNKKVRAALDQKPHKMDKKN